MASTLFCIEMHTNVTYNTYRNCRIHYNTVTLKEFPLHLFSSEQMPIVCAAVAFYGWLSLQCQIQNTTQVLLCVTIWRHICLSFKMKIIYSNDLLYKNICFLFMSEILSVSISVLKVHRLESLNVEFGADCEIGIIFL